MSALGLILFQIRDENHSSRAVCLQDQDYPPPPLIIIIIIMYIYHALINALSAHMIHINPSVYLITMVVWCRQNVH